MTTDISTIRSPGLPPKPSNNSGRFMLTNTPLIKIEIAAYGRKLPRTTSRQFYL